MNMKQMMIVSACSMLSFFGANAMDSFGGGDANERQAHDLLRPVFDTFEKGDSLSDKAFEAEVTEFQRRYGYFLSPDGAPDFRKAIPLKVKVSQIFENRITRYDTTKKKYAVRVRRVRDVIRDTEPCANESSERRSSGKRFSPHNVRRSGKTLFLSLATLGIIGVSVWAIFFKDEKKKTAPAAQ